MRVHVVAAIVVAPAAPMADAALNPFKSSIFPLDVTPKPNTPDPNTA
jgi:hypothetical protein